MHEAGAKYVEGGGDSHPNIRDRSRTTDRCATPRDAPACPVLLTSAKPPLSTECGKVRSTSGRSSTSWRCGCTRSGMVPATEGEREVEGSAEETRCHSSTGAPLCLHCQHADTTPACTRAAVSHCTAALTVDEIPRIHDQRSALLRLQALVDAACDAVHLCKRGLNLGAVGVGRRHVPPAQGETDQSADRNG